MIRTSLSGWGANKWVDCELAEPETPEQLSKWLAPAGTIARGLGRSYGDAALNGGGQVLGMARLNRFLAFDPAEGRLTCEAGVSLEDIIRTFAPRGWFPAITPGTKLVTVGGCIANDVHGKAHHVQGSFSNSVEALTVLLASGAVVRASRDENPELFWGTMGGMGLLGIVLAATLRLRPIETTYFRQEARAARNLEHLLDILAEHDQTYAYSVATLDVMARGAHLGRGIVTVGEHALRDELPPRLAKNPLALGGPPRIDVPFTLPELTLNPLSIRAINALIQLIQRHASPFGHYESFVYPLDGVSHWNRGYGRRGFTQYQFVIPFGAGVPRMRKILDTLLSEGELPFLNVLKRLGEQSAGHLSFPRPGYTFAIDLPVRARTAELLQRLDAMVLDAGGRIYLGKDSFVRPETFRAMYPRLDPWLAIKAKYDPSHTFTSDLARRVGLIGPS